MSSQGDSHVASRSGDPSEGDDAHSQPLLAVGAWAASLFPAMRAGRLELLTETECVRRWIGAISLLAASATAHARQRAGPALSHPRVWVTVLVVAAFVLLGTAGAMSSASGPPFPHPEPGVNKTYNETFRILASNDPDPYYNTSTIEVPKYEGEGGVTVTNKTVGTLPVRLRSAEFAGNLWPTQTLTAAYMTDAYYTQLDGQPMVAYRDKWGSLTALREAGWVVNTRIIRLTNISASTATSVDGQFRVEALHREGFWLPVYEVQVTETTDGYGVANPDDARVLAPLGQWKFQRQEDGLTALLRYSALADSEQEAREKAAVPMQNGEELYPTADGRSVPLVWRNTSLGLVQDAYIGIVDLERSTWYRGRYVTTTGEVTGHVPWDYRFEAPATYSESAACSSEGETYSKTNWANYRILTSDENITVTIHNETSTYELDRLRSGVWSTDSRGSASNSSLSPGNYTLTANLTVSVTLQRQYGVRSEQCDTWEKTDTVTRTVTRTYSEPVKTIYSDARGLSINATVYDKPGNDVVALNWTGDQRLTQTPWRQIEIDIGNKKMTVSAPWQFYSVAQTTAVEERSTSGTTGYNASHSYGGRYPALLRSRVSVANVTVRLSEVAPQRSWWRETHQEVADRVPATSLPDTIIAPDNTGTTPLYDTYAGVVLSTDEAMGEPVTMTADSVFGTTLAQRDTSVDVITYHNSSLDMWLEEHNDTTRVGMRLTDAETGAPLANRSLHLEGMNRATVTTSANGTAFVEPTGTLVSARFRGDDWNDSRSTYYVGDFEGFVTGHGFMGAANTVFGYIDVGISNVAVLAEWLAIGLFAYWWLRFWSPQSS